MSTIQVRGISADAHKRLKAQAKNEGKSLSEYLRQELERIAELPSLDEALARIASREPVGGEGAAADIRAARAERDAHLDSR